MAFKKPLSKKFEQEIEQVEETFDTSAYPAGSTAVAVKASTEIVDWEAQLAKEAEIAAEVEKNTGGGKFFSTRAGVLSLNKMPLPGNQMVCIILDSVFENLYYQDSFDSDNIVPPHCYALSRVDNDLTPHEDVAVLDQAQHETCKGCPQNAWGSADKGRGKACRNTRRLALIPAGTCKANGAFTPFDEAEEFQSSSIAYIRPPVTSVIDYANYVKQVSGALRRPPFGVLTKIRLEPDADTQFKMIFELVEKVPDEFMGIIFKRREEAQRDIMFTLNLEKNEAPEKPAKQQQAKKPASNGVKKAPKY